MQILGVPINAPNQIAGRGLAQLAGDGGIVGNLDPRHFDVIGSRIGRKLFIIVPALTFDFQQDYLDIDDVRYYALRIWLDVSPSRKPNLAALLWALGFHWNRRRGVWQHPCGSFDPLGSHPTDPRAKYRSYFPADILPA